MTAAAAELAALAAADVASPATEEAPETALEAPEAAAEVADSAPDAAEEAADIMVDEDIIESMVEEGIIEDIMEVSPPVMEELLPTAVARLPSSRLPRVDKIAMPCSWLEKHAFVNRLANEVLPISPVVVKSGS